MRKSVQSRSEIRLGRRQVLRAGSLAGAGVGASALLSACGEATDEADVNSHKRGPVELNYEDGNNPFGVDGDVPLDVTIFKGGYSDEYATDGHEVLYANKFPNAEIIHLSTEQISEVVQPRMRSFDPPDVLMNAGGERMEMDQLVEDGQLLDLRVLLEAPSYDDPSKTVGDTLRAGVPESGHIGGGEEVWGLPYDFAGYGLWYSQKLFRDNDWEPPKTWTDFINLCAQIKAAGIAPMTYQGKFPYYMLDPIITLAVRHGGRDVINGLNDDFGSGSWGHDSLEMAVQAWEDFVKSGYLLEGSTQMTHLVSQDAWMAGDAAFIPCGSWLENEQKDSTPEDFEMGFIPIPSLDGSLEPNLVQASPGEHFVIPKFANNPAGGLEYLRLMLSAAGSAAWTDHTAALNVVSGVEFKTERPGVSQLKPYLDDDANLFNNTIEVEHGTFVLETLYPAITDLMRGEVKASDFIKKVQRGA